MSRILYLKIEQSVLVPQTSVKLGHIASMECNDSAVVNRLKTEKFMEIDDNFRQKQVVSVLYVIQKIHEIYPELEIENLGESDFIIGLKPGVSSKKWEGAKVIFVSAVSFFGAVFSVMTFNEDASVLDSFRKVYTWVMGTPPVGATILEISYSLGFGIGILVFFNHIGRKKLTEEPSPVEVEMSGYDKQVYETLIQQESRKGFEKDVG